MTEHLSPPRDSSLTRNETHYSKLGQGQPAPAKRVEYGKHGDAGKNAAAALPDLATRINVIAGNAAEGACRRLADAPAKLARPIGAKHYVRKCFDSFNPCAW